MTLVREALRDAARWRDLNSLPPWADFKIELIKGAGHSVPPVCEEAFRVLKRYIMEENVSEALDAVSSLAREGEYPWVRAYAVQYLSEASSIPSVVETIASSLQDESWEVRREVVLGLTALIRNAGIGAAQIESVKDSLRGSLEDVDARVRLLAARSIIELQINDLPVELGIAALRKLSDSAEEDGAVRVSAIGLLIEQREWSPGWMNDPDPLVRLESIRGSAYQLTEGQGALEALARLEQATQDPDHQVKEVAEDLLVKGRAVHTLAGIVGGIQNLGQGAVQAVRELVQTLSQTHTLPELAPAGAASGADLKSQRNPEGPVVEWLVEWWEPEEGKTSYARVVVRLVLTPWGKSDASLFPGPEAPPEAWLWQALSTPQPVEGDLVNFWIDVPPGTTKAVALDVLTKALSAGGYLLW